MQSFTLQGYWSAYSARLCPFLIKTKFSFFINTKQALQGYHIAYSARLCPFSVKAIFHIHQCKVSLCRLLECIFSMALCPFLVKINFPYLSMQSKLCRAIISHRSLKHNTHSPSKRKSERPPKIIGETLGLYTIWRAWGDSNPRPTA